MNRRGLWVVLGLFGALFLVLFMLLSVTASNLGGKSGHATSGRGVGVIEILGEIGDSKKILREIRDFDQEVSVKSVLVRIDSPGGAVAPSQEIYQELKRLNEHKKVIVSMGSLAASGGYYAALGADKIVANPGTLTGSIGVIMQSFDASKLFALTKLESNVYKSGALKDMGNPLHATTEDERKVFAGLIASVYDQFVKAVVESRHLDEKVVRALADGRVYTGEQALEKKLVDQLGSFQTALDLAAEAAEIKGKPELVYPSPDDEENFLVRMVKESTKTAVGELTSHLHGHAEPKYLFGAP
jgi:protease-4